MSQKKTNNTLIFNNQILKIITIIFSLAAAYFLTIQSLKIELAGKADSHTVEIVDKKLTKIEAILKEGVLDKEQFYQFSKQLERRLSRIEFLLENQTGENLGKNR
jgi:hypothetical protein